MIENPTNQAPTEPLSPALEGGSTSTIAVNKASTGPTGQKSAKQGGSAGIFIAVGLLIMAAVAVCCCVIVVLVAQMVAANSGMGGVTPPPAPMPQPAPVLPPVSTENPYYYLMDCRIYRLDGGNLTDVTSNFHDWPQKKDGLDCNFGLLSADNIVGYREGEKYTTFHLDLQANKAIKLNLPADIPNTYGLGYDQTGDLVYIYIPEDGQILSVKRDGTRKQVAQVADRQIIGRDGVTSDEISIKLSPAKQYILINDTVTSTETQGDTMPKQAAGVMVFDMTGKLVKEFVGQKARWVNNEEVVFISGATIDQDGDYKLKKYNVKTGETKVLSNKAYAHTVQLYVEGSLAYLLSFDEVAGRFTTESYNTDDGTLENLGAFYDARRQAGAIYYFDSPNCQKPLKATDFAKGECPPFEMRGYYTKNLMKKVGSEPAASIIEYPVTYLY
jgi:hypothetical protein